jgi:circadian clock protein KaiC
LSLHLHELLTYLGQLGVVTFTTNTQSGLLSLTNESAIDASYLADTVIALRYYEVSGEIRQALSVVKRRSGNHERTLRRVSFSERGIAISDPLREYRGLLTGVPAHIAETGSAHGGE